VRRDAGGRPLVVSSHEALAWYLEGARTHVSLAGPPVLAVRIDDDGDTLFVSANEADRLIAEELLPEDADRVVRVPWHQPVLEAAGSGMTEAEVAPALRAARASLLPAEADRYRDLGRETAEVLTAVATGLSASSTYAASGFDADEWTKHHQGGPTGYAGRDPRATTLTTDAVVSSHAFAWNPSAPGAKVEDTVLVTESGIEVLTVDPAWPTVEFAGVQRPVARAFG